MNLPTFYIALGIGTLVAIYMSWRYSRKGIHPRFYPHFGLVAMVFMVLMGAVAVLAFLLSRLVGNEDPPARLPVAPVEDMTKPAAPEEKKAEP